MISKKTIKFLCLSAAASALVAFSVSDVKAQASLTMDLKDAVAIGVDTNPEYGIVAASRRATDEELAQGRALYLPSIDVAGDTGYQYVNPANSQDQDHWRYEIGTTLTQMLFDGWATKNEVERQKARVESSSHRVRETSELVGLTIVESYLEVMRQRQLLMISRQNVQEHMSIMQTIQDAVNAGRSTQADMEQAKARLAAARAGEANSRQSLRNAESEFRREVGDAPGELSLPAIPYDQLSADVDQEVHAALANSPTLDIFESDIEVSYAESKATKSTFYPQLDLQLNARQGDNLDGVKGQRREGSALVVMDWNLYRGGADNARAREFVHRHQQQKEERADAARQVEDDVRQSWASMIAAGERAREFAAQVDANSQVVLAYKDQFSLDRRTLLDVLDAQNEMFVSRSNTVNAEFIEMLAVYRLLALKGDLFPTLGLPYPRESHVAARDSWENDEKVEAR